MSQGLSGKRVFVTAGAAGIGRAIAEAFVAADARVVVCDVDEAALAQVPQWGPDVLARRADVSEPDDVAAAFHAIVDAHGGLDVLVNNAGVAGPTARVNQIAYSEWRRTLAVNLDGAFLCSRNAAALMRACGGGSIVNIASNAGLFGYPYRAPYAASKWGLIGLTKTLAMELGPEGIRVNAVCPGSVEGERIDRVIAAEAAERGVAADEVRRGYARQSSLRRFVTARDVAAAVLFLCSDAGASISGQALGVDGHTEGLF